MKSAQNTINKNKITFLIAALLGLCGGLLMIAVNAKPASAQPPEYYAGTTVSVQRTNERLFAATNYSSLADEWRWLRRVGSKCKVADFSKDDKNSAWRKSKLANRGGGNSLVIQAKDSYVTYCFYVKLTTGAKAVGTYKVMPARINIVEDDTSMTASLNEELSADVGVKENTWRWYRYAPVTYSTFGCSPSNYGLTQEELKEATKKGIEKTVYGGIVLIDSYPQQKGVYTYGKGKTVDLDGIDNGLVYCFMVTDSAGIIGKKPMRVAQTRNVAEPAPPTTEQNTTADEDRTDSGSTSSTDDEDLPPMISEEVPTTSESTVTVATEEEVHTQEDGVAVTPEEVEIASDESAQEEGKDAGTVDGASTDPNNENQAQTPTSGTPVANEPETEAGNEEGGGSGWIVGVGVGLIIIALVVAGAWLISRSRIKDKEVVDFDNDESLE